MKVIEFEEKYGFKYVNIPKIYTFKDFFKDQYNAETQADHNSALYLLKTTFCHRAVNSEYYYPGDYYIRNTDTNEYFIHYSPERIGVSMLTKGENGVDSRSVAYDIQDDDLVMMWTQNTVDSSTHISRRYPFSDIQGLQNFQDGEIETFLEEFFNECYKCEGLEKIINIDELREKVYGKLGRTLS